VTSVLQTTAGKMIFGKWDERASYSRQAPSAVPVTSAVVPVPTPTAPAVAAPAIVDTKPGAS
jgi:hypothetical protein